jgi:hypothetical protein
VIAGEKLLDLLEQRSLFEQSLLNPSVTSGRNANCFFQAFMHVFSRLPNKIYLELFQDSQYKLSLQYFGENFNQAYSKLLPKPFTLKEIIKFSRTLHPLDRELIFGPILRATFNTLVKAKLIQTEALGLGENDIVLAHQTLAFANCFGARLTIYMSEEEFNKAQASGMPAEVVDRVSKFKVADGAVFICDRPVDQPSLWEVNLVYGGVHLNYTHGTPERNQHERKQVIMSQSAQDACFASAPVDSSSAPLFSAKTEDILAFRMLKLFGQFSDSKKLTELLSKNAGLFRRLEDGFLEEHRHDDPKIQQEYDKRFGLIIGK